MELRHLRFFLAFAEELHSAPRRREAEFRAVALSRAIKKLEEKLGARLFACTTQVPD